MRMFERCVRWLGEMQEHLWLGQPWGRSANYIVPEEGEETTVFGDEFSEPDEDMLEVVEVVNPVVGGNALDQFQWP